MNLDFTVLQKAIMNNFENMKEERYLFEVDLNKDELWDVYLDSFPPGTNEIFRERREYDCSCCRQFIKSIGHAVAIVDGKIKTIWDVDTGNGVFNQVVHTLDEFVKSHTINNIYLSDSKKVGTLQNFEESDGEIIKWDHFYLELPKNFVQSSLVNSIASTKGSYRSKKDVFQRAMEEITEDSVEIILELISQNSLYKGEEWQATLQEFLKYKKEYIELNN